MEKILEGYKPYSKSVNMINGKTVYMSREGSEDILIIVGGDLGFEGSISEVNGIKYTKAPLTHNNACKLREHFPFTAPKPEDIELLESNPGQVRANAYDLVINGVEIGGGSVRIFDSALQSKMFKLLGFTEEQANAQFGFLMNAFKYGAPPHAGIAFGFDRLVSLFAGLDSIRDVIAFPKNNTGRDVMNDAPSQISEEQLKELFLKIALPQKQS